MQLLPTFDTATPRLRRNLVQVRERAVHFLSVGHGPAVALIHGSPADSTFLRPLALRLAHHFATFAFDTPGFGDSVPLSSPELTVAALADAYAETFAVLGLTGVIVFGTHSGAAIGLELARRHPGLVSGAVLEGVPIFTRSEQAELLDDRYMPMLAPDPLGGHLVSTWTRFRDQSIWFPWFSRDYRHLLEGDLESPIETHRWVQMYYRAARSYRPVYRAAISYGDAAVLAASELRVPVTFICESADMLFSHLDRLPSLPAGCRIERIKAGAAKDPAIDRALAQLPRGSEVESAACVDVSSGPRAFIEVGGRQTLIRRSGRLEAPPVLLLHDVPGTGRSLEPLADALSRSSRVFLPDVPGSGDSEPLSLPAINEFADAMAEIMVREGAEPYTVYGIGFGAALGLAMARRHSKSVSRLMITGICTATGTERSEMHARYAPPIDVASDGAHWYRTWLMLRDSLIYWPWYSRKCTALRRQPVDLSGAALHEWVTDVMKQSTNYGDLINAVLEWDAAVALEDCQVPIIICVDARNALYLSDQALATRLAQFSVVRLSPETSLAALELERAIQNKRETAI